ncbi:acyl-CoA dehydrogenase family protein [Microbacterium sp. NPDC055357]
MMGPGFYDSNHHEFRALVREFVAREVTPNLDRWEEQGVVDRDVWLAAAESGLLGLRTPEFYGGAGVADYRYRAIVSEELGAVGAASFGSGLAINEDVVGNYLLGLGSDAQKAYWLPEMAAGRVVTSIAMSEPGIGSDLRGMTTRAIRDGNDWRLSGAKTFITNGTSSNVVIVAARSTPTDEKPRLTLFLIPTDRAGFSRGRTLDKIGLHAQDTCELFFDNVPATEADVVGEVDGGFRHLTAQLPLERLSIAWRALAGSEAALRWTLEYVKDRKAFGSRIIDFQATRFRLAELSTEIEVTRAFLESLVPQLNRGELGATTAAKAKWWSTEQQHRVVSSCLQLFGGYGYMEEYPIARAFRDSRVQTIVGGTTEIMKEIIGRELAAD